MMRHNQGFTLLELLMAIGIFGMVIGLAYSSYNATFHIVSGAESQAETYAKARVAMERIMEDLESCYPSDEMVFKGTSESIGNYRADTLQFSSTAHIPLHPDNTYMSLVLIHYQVQEDPDNDSLLLYRKELSVQSDEVIKDDPGLLLCDNLQEVAFDYQDKEGQNLENWGEEEEVKDAASLPSLITISLRFKNEEEGEAGTLFQTGVTLPVARK